MNEQTQHYRTPRYRLAAHMDIPMIHLAGQTDAGFAGEQLPRDSQPGRRISVEGQPTCSPTPLFSHTADRNLEPPHASENSDFRQAGGSLISKGHLCNSR